MRNDARPMGEAGPQSPTGESTRARDAVRPSGEPSEQPDAREDIAHDRQSHVIHRQSEADQPSEPHDPITPSSGSTPRRRI